MQYVIPLLIYPLKDPELKGGSYRKLDKIQIMMISGKRQERVKQKNVYYAQQTSR